MGLSFRQIPQGKLKLRSLTRHLMDCGHTTYIIVSSAYTITYYGVI
jgi:hypothetical protein